MAKRFIDSNFFNDPFILSLKHDSKLLYIYFFTICDHAGVFEMNRVLGNLHLNCKNYEVRVLSFLQNQPQKLQQLDDNYYLLMRYCYRQYPGGVNTKVRQIQGALSILNSWNIEVINNQTFTLRVNKGKKELITVIKDYDNDNGNEYVIEEEEIIYNKFYDNQLSENKEKDFIDKYEILVKVLFGKVGVRGKLDSVLKMTNQLTFEQFLNLYTKCTKMNFKLSEMLFRMENWKDLNKKNKNVYDTAYNWLNKDDVK